MTPAETLDQLSLLDKGCVVSGCVLHQLWRSVLDLWLSDNQGRVFIVTPHIDADRLTDVCMLYLNHKIDAALDMLCIPLAHVKERFASVRSKVIKRFSPKDQVYLEYKEFGNVVYPITAFSSSFISIVRNGMAHVLVTNVPFDRESFLKITSANVQYLEMTETQFITSHIDPLLS